ncbi:MAG: hypothetical protein N2327_00475 [Caldimicrobium sp.]|nr:hypothetical protein [Caldimicrobium sp.]MCX7872900.1 hypothetical protein [Caldimicrobium sp.]MDW8094492.1 hypothetical protein [Caldimicrobium sp.]
MKLPVLLLLVYLILTSCGKKTSPLPIEKSIPEDPQLEIEITPLGFNLWINLPSQTKGGFPLNKISSLIIEREERSLESPSKPKFKHIVLKPKLHSAARLFLYSDTELKGGHEYRYRLKIKKDFLVSSPFVSEKVVFWSNPPSFPEKFQILPLEHGKIKLSWETPKVDIKNHPLKGEVFFRIEKQSGDKTISFETKEKSLIEEFRGDMRICYRLQAILNYQGTLIPGLKTAPLCYP